MAHQQPLAWGQSQDKGLRESRDELQELRIISSTPYIRTVEMFNRHGIFWDGYLVCCVPNV